MMRKRLPADKSDDLRYREYAEALEGYSGSDLTLLCKEAAMRPVRRLMDKLEALEEAQQVRPRGSVSTASERRSLRVALMGSEDCCCSVELLGFAVSVLVCVTVVCIDMYWDGLVWHAAT